MALLLPSAINWSSLEERTFTIANSVATKKPVKANKMVKIDKLSMVSK